MSDQTIKDALVALGNFIGTTLEGQLSLTKLIANRMPGLSPADQEELLSALDRDRKRLENLQAVLKSL